MPVASGLPEAAGMAFLVSAYRRGWSAGAAHGGFVFPLFGPACAASELVQVVSVAKVA